MKKLVVICLSLVMLLSVCTTAFAANGSFVKSPSRNKVPVVIGFTSHSNEDGQCDAELVVTAYGDRDTLSDEYRAKLEKAYGEIAGTQDLTTLSSEIEKVAEDKKIDDEDLAVSDLFDVHITGCTVHKDHTGYDVELDSENLARFVCFIHLNEDDEWEVVENAKVTDNGKRLKFSIKDFSPFAIVVDAGEEETEPGDNSMIYIWAIVAVASGALLVALLAKKKKHEQL